MIKKNNELAIVSSIVVAFFILLSVSYYLADAFNKLTGSRMFLVFYRDSDLAFYTFWAVLLIPIVFFLGHLRPIKYSVGIKVMPSQNDFLLILITLILWTIPNFLFPGTDGAYPLNEVLYVNILPALVEEILFRGSLLLLFVHLLKKYEKGQFYALILTSLLFAFWHFSPLQFQPNLPKLFIHFLGGLTLGFLFLRTKWLLPCMLIHYLGNLSHFYFPYFRALF